VLCITRGHLFQYIPHSAIKTLSSESYTTLIIKYHVLLMLNALENKMKPVIASKLLAVSSQIRLNDRDRLILRIKWCLWG
jgi:hypothetical protein